MTHSTTGSALEYCGTARRAKSPFQPWTRDLPALRWMVVRRALDCTPAAQESTVCWLTCGEVLLWPGETRGHTSTRARKLCTCRATSLRASHPFDIRDCLLACCCAVYWRAKQLGCGLGHALVECTGGSCKSRRCSPCVVRLQLLAATPPLKAIATINGWASLRGPHLLTRRLGLSNYCICRLEHPYDWSREVANLSFNLTPPALVEEAGVCAFRSMSAETGCTAAGVLIS